jgi:hypothetical protein
VLNVEEEESAKDALSTFASVENGASANLVFGKNNQNNKNKGKMQVGGKPMKSTNFKKKNTRKDNGACFVCVKGGHLVKDCPHHKTHIDGEQKKAVNVTIGKINSDVDDHSGYGILPFVFSAMRQRLIQWMKKAQTGFRGESRVGEARVHARRLGKANRLIWWISLLFQKVESVSGTNKAQSKILKLRTQI